MKLVLIGYWHNIYEPEWPDPAWFVDYSWDESIKKRVMAHLESGIQMPLQTAGYSWCRFRCGEKSLGSLEYTDGKYIWPEGLEHYIKVHGIRLPNSIVSDFLHPGESFSTQIKDYSVDSDWWKSQKGWNMGNKSFKDLLDIGIVTIEQFDRTLVKEQQKLLKNFFDSAHGVRQKLKLIDNITSKGFRTAIKGHFEDYLAFEKKAFGVGLKAQFTELSFNEYENYPE
jgi:hypothetical protein